MTICVAVAVHDCLVFAADSASTLVITDPRTRETRIVNVYRHGQKVFNLHRKLPVCAMTAGMGNLGTSSIGTLAKVLRQRFMNGGDEWHVDPQAYTVEEIATKARKYLFEECFAELDPPPQDSLEFWIGGYGSDKSTGHEVWKIEILGAQCGPPAAMLKKGSTGLLVGGQIDPINRLVIGIDPGAAEHLMAAGMDTKSAHQCANYLRSKLEVQLLAPTMPVQDAIDLADFLAETTKRFYRFYPGADIVGGDTDIAVVTRYEGFKWVQRKHYYPAHLNPLETDHA